MLSRTVYETLPYGYMTIGSVSFIMLEQTFALVAASVVFVLGARIYNMRSDNRRTDTERRRKKGAIPSFIYNFLPFISLLIALVIFRNMPNGYGPLYALCFLTYGLYVLLRRASYRQHRIPRFI